MAPRGDTYSKVIGWLKILLPMIALGMLSTLFLVSRTLQPARDLPFARSQNGAAEEQVVSPYYAGTTPDGDAVTMTASTARPLDSASGDLAAEGMTARLDLKDGSRISMVSDLATLRQDQQQALLEGGVHIESTTGYVLDTERMLTALNRIEAETLGPVQGGGPVGTFTAGKLRIMPLGPDGDVQLLFTDGVNLIYHPKEQ